MITAVSNEFLATQFPKFLPRTLDVDHTCKEEATSGNAQDVRKKGHSAEQNLCRRTN
jgi:hypothetical protein